MRQTRSLIIALLLGTLAALHATGTSAGFPPKSVGLTGGPNATVLKDGKPHLGVGINYFDCFLRTLQ